MDSKARLVILPLAKIRRDKRTQARVGLDDDTLNDYAESAKAGAEFPPIVAFWDGIVYWLADGWHRTEAFLMAGIKHVKAKVFDGTLRDAILYSVSANSLHGLRRTNEDKRRAVRMLLDDAEWSAWATREIARRCAVSESFVRVLRDELQSKSARNALPQDKRFFRKGDSIYQYPAHQKRSEDKAEHLNHLNEEAKIIRCPHCQEPLPDDLFD